MATGMGETTVDFTAAGADLVTVSVSRATVAAATTHIEAYLFPKSTGSGVTDHTADEHIIDPPEVFAHTIVDGVGFSITAVSGPQGRSLRTGPDYHTGKYTVRWVATE